MSADVSGGHGSTLWPTSLRPRVTTAPGTGWENAGSGPALGFGFGAVRTEGAPRCAVRPPPGGPGWAPPRGAGAPPDARRARNPPPGRGRGDWPLELLTTESSDPQYLAPAMEGLGMHVHRVRGMGSIAISCSQLAMTRCDGFMTLWRTRAVAGSGEIRKFAIYGKLRPTLEQGGATLASWLIPSPDDEFEAIPFRVAIALSAGLALAALVSLGGWPARGRSRGGPAPGRWGACGSWTPRPSCSCNGAPVSLRPGKSRQAGMGTGRWKCSRDCAKANQWSSWGHST